MGFFLDEAEVARKLAGAPKAASGRSKTKEARARITAGVRGCDACSLKVTWARNTSPRLRLTGNTTTADILVLGEWTTEADDRAGKAFTPADRDSPLNAFRKLIPTRHMDRIAYGNLVRCHAATDITQADAHSCSIHLEDDVARLPIKAILGVGQFNLSYFFPGASVVRVNTAKFPVALGAKTVWYYPITPMYTVEKYAGKQYLESSAAFHVTQADVKQFFSQVDSWPKPKVHTDIKPEAVLFPETRAETLDLLNKMQEPVAVDFEANTLRVMERTARMVSASFSDGETTIAFPVDHPEKQHPWALPLILEQMADRHWIAHQAGMELGWAKGMAQRAGLAFEPGRYEDTMALARVYHQRETILGLGDLTHIHLGVNVKALSHVNAARVMEYPLSDILPYNGLDSLGTVRLFDALDSLVRSTSDRDNYTRIMEATGATAEMMLLGLPVNREASVRLKQEWVGRRQEAEETARSLYEVKQFELHVGPFNIAAPEHVGRALVEYGKISLPKTPSGKQYSTDDSLLQDALEAGNPFVRAIMDYREAAKMDVTYVDPFLAAKERFIDECVHPSYNTMLVSTLRLSSEDPNIQNIPVRSARQRGLRRQIACPPGKLLYKFDQGQLEARVIAMASKCRALCSSIIAGEDIHSYWLNRILNEYYPDYHYRLAEKLKLDEDNLKDILKGGRNIIKTDFVFASFYGAHADSCANRTGMPVPIARTLAREFWGVYKGAQAHIKSQRSSYAATGRVSTLTRRMRHAILSGNEPINNPIQGAGADIVTDAMNALSKMSLKLKEPDLHPRMNIHDDLSFFLPEDIKEAEPYIDIIVEEMLRVRYDWQIVPLMVEAAVGEHWDETYEFGKFVGDYVK